MWGRYREFDIAICCITLVMSIWLMTDVIGELSLGVPEEKTRAIIWLIVSVGTCAASIVFLIIAMVRFLNPPSWEELSKKVEGQDSVEDLENRIHE